MIRFACVEVIDYVKKEDNIIIFVMKFLFISSY